MDSEGYVRVEEILALRHKKWRAQKSPTLDDVLHVVEYNSKKRFEIDGQGLELRIRASQVKGEQVCVCVFP